jgi:hypothetical protein
MLVLDYIAVIVVTEESGMCGAAVERQSARRQQQAKNRGALTARSGSIRHMIIESGFLLEASWIVGTKKDSPAGLLGYGWSEKFIWFRCQAWP